MRIVPLLRGTARGPYCTSRNPRRDAGGQLHFAVALVQEKHKAPAFPGPFGQGNGRLAIASAVACCTGVRHSLASPRRGTIELSPVTAKESSRNQAKAVQNRPLNCCKVFWANNMRYVPSFSRGRMLSRADAIQTTKCHRNQHITLRPVCSSAQRYR